MSLRKRTSLKKHLRTKPVNLSGLGRVRQVLGLFRNNLFLQVSSAFLLVLALKGSVLHDPPVWDTAMSVFPAAITLEAYDFDLPRLLAEPRYLHAGPNVYADSLVTLITALVIRITGDTKTFLPTLHLLHFLITAFALVATYRYARPLLGDGASFLAVLALLTFPVFLTQAGFMYLEMPLTLTTMMAFLAWRKGHSYQAALWAFISLWIKSTGILVPFALWMAAVLGPGRIRDRFRQATIVGLLPLMYVPLRVWLTPPMAQPRVLKLDPEAFQCIGSEFSRYLIRVPDLAVFLGLFLLGCGIFYQRVWAGLRQNNQGDSVSEQNQCLALNCVAVCCFLVVAFLVAPFMLGGCYGLPRYYVSVLPFILTTLTFFLMSLMNWKRAALVLTLTIAFFLVNRNGVFYPSDVNQSGSLGNNFALTERSGAYRELARLQREAMHFLETLPPDIPIYFGHHEGYLNRYPAMGYVKSTMPNAVSVSMWNEQTIEHTLSNPPECSYFLYNYPWLGGKVIETLVDGLKSTHRAEHVKTFQSGEHKIVLLRTRAIGTNCRSTAP